MTKEEFIKEAHRLSLEFAQLCWEFNTSESADCSAEIYGSKSENPRSTIILTGITFSMQQMKSDVLTDSVKPATLSFDIGNFDAAKRICGSSHFNCKDVHELKSIASAATELEVIEYAYGKEVKA